jgi:hypothetical protein
MSDFSETWELVRTRFVNEVSGLSHDQLAWKMYPHSLSIGEMALHVAGVEVSFTTQLLQEQPDELGARLKAAATDGVVNDLQFPFTKDELTPETIKHALRYAEAKLRPVIVEASDEIRAREIKSALGPMINGTGAFARLAYHPGYHQGQAYQVKAAPGFPA